MAERLGKGPRSDAEVEEMRKLMASAAAFAPVLQALHDISLLLGARCNCGKRLDDEHEHEKPHIKEE